jgi:transposase
MEVTYTHCAGLDVHKKTVVACTFTSDEAGNKRKEVRTFGTMTANLLALSDWLKSQQVTHVAMESTGEFWKPVYNILEGNFELLVVNARHIKNVPGRKTDVKDAEWIADLLRHGLLRGSFIPDRDQRDLRDLTRQRTNLVEDRARVVNRLQKVNEWSNIKLSAVVSDITGVSARAMLNAIVEDRLAPEAMAALARGQLRHKREALAQALTGIVGEHHRFMLAQALVHIDFLDEQIAQFDREITARMAAPGGDDQPPALPGAEDASEPKEGEPVNGNRGESGEEPAALPPLSWAEAVVLLDTMPGVSPRTAELMLAEFGCDMRRFPTAAHLASWAKLSPGNNQSADTNYSGAIGHGNRWLRSALVQAAWAAIRVKDSYLGAFYHRLAARRGAKRAIVAVAHRMLIAAYHMLSRHEPFHDLGATYWDKRNEPRIVNRAKRRIEQFGYQVILLAPEPAVA